MSSISLCMIVKNEENNLEKCLASSHSLVDEIIIVDTGSTDSTKSIAEKFSARIYDFDWVDDFSKARNFAFSKATMDFQMWLDADDVILEEDQKKILQLKERLTPDVDVVMMYYNTGLDSNGKPTLRYYRGRLFNRLKNFKWHDQVHEFIPVSGNSINEDIAITHTRTHSNGTRNLDIYRSMRRNQTPFTPRNQYYFAKELYYNAYYEEAITEFISFLDDDRGWFEDRIWACRELSFCYKALNRKNDALQALLRSFLYALPRAETCCALADIFFEKNNLEEAIYWYQLALTCKKPSNSWGFSMSECYGYLPCISLCLCYFRLNNIEKSKYYNDLAGYYRPNDKSVIYNQDFFASLKKTE